MLALLTDVDRASLDEAFSACDSIPGCQGFSQLHNQTTMVLPGNKALRYQQQSFVVEEDPLTTWKSSRDMVPDAEYATYLKTGAGSVAALSVTACLALLQGCG